MKKNLKTPAEKTSETYAMLGDKYLKDISNATPPELFDFIKFFPKGSKVLDVGTAGGRDAKFFADAGMNVTGIDMVGEFLDRAKKDVPSANFIQMDVRNMNFPESFFEGIYANAVLLHLEKKEVPLVLDKFYALLKPKGKLHIRLKEGEGEKEIIEKLSQNHSRFFSFFSKEEIEELLEKSGFKIIRSEEMSDTLDREGLKWISIWGEK